MTPRRTTAVRTTSRIALLVACFAGAGEARGGTPSPADWRDIPVYQIFTDRFYDGDPSNNDAEGSYDPGSATGPSSGWNPGNVHGGDLAGVLAKLDYIQALGFRAVWVSPVQLNQNGVYHGYAARDWKAIAPHFGTEAELHALADALHARGMYLILDVVCNHMADLIRSRTAGYPTFHADPSPYVLEWRGSARPAAPFDNLSWFHNNGEIQNYVDPDQVLGELAGLDDLRTENPAVRDALVDAFSWLITVSDADGFRIDTVKHADLAFWQTWTPAVRAHAASLGKTNFLFYGEVFDGSDAKNGMYTGTQGGGAFALNSVLYFPMHFTMNDVFAYGQATSLLGGRYAQLSAYAPEARERLLHFLDNHDVARFLSFGVANQDASRLRTALDFLLTTRGIPVVYQGTEQGFDGGGDPYDREDMWDGAWEYGPSQGDNFNMTHALYRHARRLLDARARYEALRTGVFTELASSSGEGIYAYRREGTEDVLVAINTASTSRSTGPLATRWGAGTALEDLREPATTAAVGSGGLVTVSVPGRSTRLFVRAAAWTPETPAVETQSPAHAALVGGLRPAVRLAFNRSMDRESVEGSFHLDPGAAGSFSWEADTAFTFTPAYDLAPGARYRVRVERMAGAGDGTTLRAAYESFFTTPGGVPGLSVAVGYAAREVASGSGLGVPEGIARGESGSWAGAFFVGDAGGNRILRVTPAGTVAVHAVGAPLDKPEGLDFDRSGVYGGDLLVADAGGLLRVGPGGALSTVAAGTAATSTGALFCAPPGPFGGFAYLGSHALNRVERWEGTAFAIFAAPVPGFEGIAEARGAFGTDRLLVANPNLTAWAGSIDGDGSILEVDAAGVLSVRVHDAARLSGATALLVDPGGRFGGDLLVADVVGESVLRVSAGGTVSVLASGFGNLFGSDCLAVGEDGALYVVDTGSGETFTDSSGGTATARIVRIAVVESTGAPSPPPPPVSLRASPNPLAGPGRVVVALPVGARVEVSLFDLAGRRVAAVWEGELPAGESEIPFEPPPGLARGVYFLELRAPGETAAARVVIL